MQGNTDKLMATVIDNDYCIGCGICASVDNSPFVMKFDDKGKYRPYLKEAKELKQISINVNEVCPFSNDSKDETELGRELFSTITKNSDKYSGYYIKQYAGHIKKGDYREKGSSGGMGTWIATKLLEQGLVDGIIHVRESGHGIESPLFQYEISKDVASLKAGAKSKYYPIELSEVIRKVKKTEGNYALIGIPCFIKSVRLLAQKDKVLNESIKFYIGLVCGHLKSDMFAKSIGWQLGIQPKDLSSIDFRKKLPDRGANDYGVEVTGEKNGNETSIVSPTKELYTTNWGQGFFKYNACEFCDDVLAETADITIGDAWLPEYTGESLGTNIIIVRHPVIQGILEENEEELHLDELSPEKIYQSQAGGFRHRREGLAVRLHNKDSQNEWRPKKRVEANNKVKRRKTYDMRSVLTKESFKAYKKAEKSDDFNVFIKHMDPFKEKYNKVASVSILRRILGKVKREVQSLVK